MEFLDRYLKAVRSYLPDEQKDDIINELSENIRSQVEEKEAELGRPLNESESEAILKQHGHPLIVAGRYRQDHRRFAFGREWIGPVLFPFYAKVLSFNLGITSAVLLIIFAALMAAGQPLSLLENIPSVFFYQLLIQFGIVTIIFSIMDRHLAKFPDRWDPRRPKYPDPYYPNLLKKDTQHVPRLESISQLISLCIAIVWLRVLQRVPFLIFGGAAGFLRLAPVWHQFYWPVVLIALAGMVQAGINLVRPDWVRLRTVVRTGMGIAALVMWCFLLKVGPWVVLGEVPADKISDHARTADIINQCVFYSLLFAVIVSAGQLLRDLFRLVRGAPSRAPSRVS